MTILRFSLFCAFDNRRDVVYYLKFLKLFLTLVAISFGLSATSAPLQLPDGATYLEIQDKSFLFSDSDRGLAFYNYQGRFVEPFEVSSPCYQFSKDVNGCYLKANPKIPTTVAYSNRNALGLKKAFKIKSIWS